MNNLISWSEAKYETLSTQKHTKSIRIPHENLRQITAWNWTVETWPRTLDLPRLRQESYPLNQSAVPHICLQSHDALNVTNIHPTSDIDEWHRRWRWMWWYHLTKSDRKLGHFNEQFESITSQLECISHMKGFQNEASEFSRENLLFDKREILVINSHSSYNGTFGFAPRIRFAQPMLVHQCKPKPKPKYRCNRWHSLLTGQGNERKQISTPISWFTVVSAAPPLASFGAIELELYIEE